MSKISLATATSDSIPTTMLLGLKQLALLKTSLLSERVLFMVWATETMPRRLLSLEV